MDFFFSSSLKIHITSQALKYLYQFNVIIKHTRNIFSPLIVPYSVNLPIRPFWNNKNNYEIWIQYMTSAYATVYIFFFIILFCSLFIPIFFNVVYLFYTYLYIYLCFCGCEEILTLRHIKYDYGCFCIYLPSSETQWVIP